MLFAIWSWSPRAPAPLPPHYAEPADAHALAALPADTPFLLTGTLRPARNSAGRSWQGRDVYVHRIRRDHGGRGSSRHVGVDTIATHRPTLYLHWQGGIVAITADSYRLDFAPRIEPPRGASWDRASRGFHAGDTALALGRTGRDGRYWIESLLAAPLAKVHNDIEDTQRPRRWLWLAAQLAASALLLSLGLASRTAHSRPALRCSGSVRLTAPDSERDPP